MTSIRERSSDSAEREEGASPSGGTTLDVGQRRAATWPRLEPSVALRPAMDVLVGVVHTADAVRLIATARDDEALLRQLAAYVAANASHTLWASDAARVQGLLAAREFEAAVRTYFTAADTPWDREWLVIELVHQHWR